jgi:HD-GYP domain-containing protein (c-di-GMP phosphodiesterase class II)
MNDDTKNLTDPKSPIESGYNSQYFNLEDYIAFFQHTSELSSQPNRLMQYITEFLFDSFSLDGVACFFSSSLVHSVQKPHLEEKYAKLLQDPTYLMKEENIRKGISPHQEVLIHAIQSKIKPKGFFLMIQRNINQDHGYYELMKNFLASISTIAENAFLAQKEQTMLQDLVSVQLECLNSRIEGGKLHSHNVQRLALDIASAMGMKQKDRDALEIGGLLFDIGKIGISDEILNSPSHLSAKEYEIVKKHVEFGRSIIANFQTLTEDIRQIVYSHHELIDGSGYPKGLKGDQIPLKAKIICVCDVYCAMTEKRAYREAWTQEEALRWIETNAGILYDPNVVQHLLKVLEDNHD